MVLRRSTVYEAHVSEATNQVPAFARSTARLRNALVAAATTAGLQPGS
ncbi:hypothetical protein [Rhodococcus opacus]|nr:hypothetical protein [Rhodococcus opacus]MDJ0417172.1 hypothetical protein [Rhodococcus opacus]